MKAPFSPSSDDFQEDHRREAPRAAVLSVAEDLDALFRDIRLTVDHYLPGKERGGISHCASSNLSTT